MLPEPTIPERSAAPLAVVRPQPSDPLSPRRTAR
jgi:hypothetical protein